MCAKEKEEKGNEKLQDIVARINETYTEFYENADRFASKGIKAAGKRARKNILALKAIFTEFRKASLADDE